MIKVMFENSDIVVCLKEAGLLSEYSPTSPISLPAILCKQLGLSELFCVHRLDKEVSGIIVYAKNATSAAELSKQISNQKIKKEYVAIISGRMASKRAFLKDLLFHDKQKNKTYVVKNKRAGVKEAILEYNELEYDNDSDASAVKISLLTGRTHQIRVQFAFRGHPILGDRKYGSPCNIKPIRLHSYRLSFFDPKTNEELTFTSAPDWLQTL